jgi:hypothetical protein
MSVRNVLATAACLAAASAGAAAAQETSAYIYGLVGVFAADYGSDGDVFEKLVGYYAYPGYGVPSGAPPGWGEVELSSTDFAVSPFGFGLKGDSWRASFVALWNRRKVEPPAGSPADDRQTNNASLTGTGGYILNRGYFADKKVKPYFGGFWRGNWTKAENVHNGVIANGFGPDVGAVFAFDLNRSFILATLGYHYKMYSLTGTKFDDPRGDDPPAAPSYNYTYVLEDELPASASSFFVSAKSSLQFHRRVGAEVELRYEMDLGDSFVNGLTFAGGPSLWL